MQRKWTLHEFLGITPRLLSVLEQQRLIIVEVSKLSAALSLFGQFGK